MKSILKLLLLITIIAFFASCNNDDDNNLITKNFTVTIENVFEGKANFVSGTTSTGGVGSGGSTTFSFNAGKGHYLQFGTMFVQSNDLFYAFGDEGIALYDANGNATTGDVTSQVILWDAGTEVNEEPGVGSNQAPRQGAPNSGMDENGNVQVVNDGFTYPMTNSVIQVMLSHDGGTMFTVTINNISDASTLPTPFAPGTWVVHSQGQTPMFANGSAASLGLERLSEDGDNAAMNNNLTSNSGLVSPFAPGAYSVGSTNGIFTIGTSANTSLESLAEDGDPSGYTNAFNTPDGASSPAPIFPGESYSFSFTANELDNLSFGTMFIQSNDWYFGIDNLALFSNGNQLSGDITDMIKIYDAGTEVDQYAGAGNDQAPRQASGDTGASENGNVVEESNLSNNVPSIASMIKVTITSN